MPGIAGVISRARPDMCQKLAEQMTASMQHEKFHVAGTYSAPELGVFAGWVALDGSFGQCQPIMNEKADVVSLVAGECFVDPDTLRQLKTRGHRLEGNGSASLVHLYEEKGPDFCAELNGLFSGLVIDLQQRKALLFNDRYGMERLYYHEGRDALYFASEAKALLRILPELRAFDDDGLIQFLRYGCTIGDRTLFRHIELLPGASLWSFDEDQRCKKQRYFKPSKWERQPALAGKPFAAELENTLARVIPRYFPSDGVIGISLTGGLDTRMIMACQPERPPTLVSYTFAGCDGETLDVQLARRVAEICHVPHHVLRIDRDFFSTFASLADRTVYITDGSFGVCGAHEIYLNQQARALAPVRLTGNFGSEILRDMTTFKPLRLSDELFHPRLRVRMSEPSEPSAVSTPMNPVSFAAFREIPWHLGGVVRAAQSQVITRTPYLDNDIVALAFRAPRGTRSSSSPASRVIRENNPSLGRIPTDTGLVPASPISSLLSSLWYRVSFKLDYWYGDGMPHWFSPLDAALSCVGIRPWSPGRHKYLHYGRWLRTHLADYLRERLRSVLDGNNLWNLEFLDKLATAHIGGRNYIREIDAVLTLEAIDRLLFRQTFERLY